MDTRSILQFEPTGAASRAATKREGRAPTEPMVAGSFWPALDAEPTRTIRVVGGQDDMRQTPSSSTKKSCPQPSETKRFDSQDVMLAQDKRGRGTRRRGTRDVRNGDAAATRPAQNDAESGSASLHLIR